MINCVFFLAIVILGILQMTVLDSFKVFGVKPDLLLAGVCFTSLALKFRWAFILSAFAGIFKDALGSSVPGINTLLFPLWSFLIVRLNREMSIEEHDLIRAALVFIIAVLHNTITGLILVYLGGVVPLGSFLRIVFIQSIYTALIVPLLFKVYAMSRSRFQSS
ncbi:MAG: rod shape-determining protein MreD [Candidatus Omnitrophota bacterium]